jgi:hypothetical protein
MGRLERAPALHGSIDEQIAAIAVGQFGVFSRAQATSLGISKDVIRHRVHVGRWIQVTPYVFRLAGAPLSWRRSLMEACLAWGDGAVVSHRSAAALLHLEGFGPGPVELTVARVRQRNAPGVIHRNALPAVDVTCVEGIPITTSARTLIDIATVSPRDVTEGALDDALRRGLVSIVHLRWRLDELGARPGVVIMRSFLDARDSRPSVPGSGFERKVLRILKKPGLPEPVLQHRIRDGGRLVAIADFAYPDLRLAIEADGYRWHSGRARWQRDRRRSNELTLLGWRIIHVTWEDIRDRREAVTDSILEAMALA